MSVTLAFFTLLLLVPASEADYSFTVRFFEFRNPLGLQCGECGNGGPPACCDDVQRLENCTTTRPFTCDTRFRFLLRPFGAPVETAPNTSFPYFTPSSGGNSETFSEGPGGLLVLPNPFTITRTEEWSGRIQFFIDAIDRAVSMSTSGISETLAIINRFPIDLELNPGPDFTERTTYTGFHNISDVGFDMSFRVQCLENYFGPNCTTFCEPLEGVYTCDSEGRSVCLQDNKDPTTNCTTCLRGWDLETNCTTCIPGNDCTAISGFTTHDSHDGGDTRSTYHPSGEETTSNGHHSEGPGLNLALVGGAVGGAIGGVLLILLLILCAVILIVFQKRRKKHYLSDAHIGGRDDEAMSQTGNTNTGGFNSLRHDLENPIYTPSMAKNTNKANETTFPLEKTLEVPNPFYNEFRDPFETKSERSFTSQESGSRSRLDTFPYVMDGEELNRSSSKKSILMQKRERVANVVYESTDITPRGASTTTAMASWTPKKENDDVNVCGTATFYDNIQTNQMCDFYDDIQTIEATASAAHAQTNPIRDSGTISSSGVLNDQPAICGATKSAGNGNIASKRLTGKGKPFDNDVYCEPFSFTAAQGPLNDPTYANTGSQFHD